MINLMFWSALQSFICVLVRYLGPCFGAIFLFWCDIWRTCFFSKSNYIVQLRMYCSLIRLYMHRNRIFTSQDGNSHIYNTLHFGAIFWCGICGLVRFYILVRYWVRNENPQKVMLSYDYAINTILECYEGIGIVLAPLNTDIYHIQDFDILVRFLMILLFWCDIGEG